MIDFIDKLKQCVGKGITTVSIKSKEIVDATKVKGQIATYEKQKKSALEELGNIVYTMFFKGAFDQERVNAKCTSITNLDTQIRQKEEELKQLHLKAQEALGLPKTASICECGAEIHEGAKFCKKCGKKVETLPKEGIESDDLEQSRTP